MADEGIQVEIVSPEQLLLSETAGSVTVPGREGYFTVMADHAPLMSTLKPGFVTVNGGETRTFYVQGGFADVNEQGLTLLAEKAKAASDFERAEIEEQIRAAEQELAAQSSLDGQAAAQAVLDGWRNLMHEAQNMPPNVVQI